MSTDHAQFADWDAAFILGALSPSDRRRFEAHLLECQKCRDAIVDTAPTIGLLARLVPERAQSLLDAGEAQPGEGPDLARRSEVIAIGVGESRRRRRLWWTGGLTAAAAVIVAIVLAVSLSMTPAVRGSQRVALEPVVDVPLTASVELVDVAWGTRLELLCSYAEEPDDDGSAKSWPYALTVIAADGTPSDVSSWVALPGSTARIGAGTALDRADIAAIEIRSLTSGKVLMRAELDEPDAAADGSAPVLNLGMF